MDEFIRDNLKTLSKLQLLRLQEVISKVPRYQTAAGNDLAEVLRDHLMLGAKKDKSKAQKIPMLNEDFKSEAYESEDEYDEAEDDPRESSEAFRIRKEEDYEQNQEWKR